MVYDIILGTSLIMLSYLDHTFTKPQLKLLNCAVAALGCLIRGATFFINLGARMARVGRLFRQRRQWSSIFAIGSTYITVL